MLIGELIGHIKTILNNGPEPRTYRFNDKSIYFIIKYFRAVLIRNKASKDYFISDFNYQTLPCISLEMSKLLDCDCLPAEVGCRILRSTQPLPEILTDRNRYLLLHSSDMLGNEIPLTSFNSFKYNKYSLFKKTRPVCFIRDGYLYVANTLDLEKITLTAIFYDPLEVNDCNDDECYDPLTEDFPMDKELVATLLKMTYQEILGIAYLVPQDNENDAKDESAKANTKVPGATLQEGV